MIKKDYILLVLASLEKEWNFARGLKIVVESLDDSDEELLNSLFEVFKSSIKNINDEKTKEKMKATIDSLKETRYQEQKEYDQNRIELENLEKELKDLF